MTIFAISRKTIAAALLALAAVLFSTSVNALDRIYIASTHQVPVEVSCSNTAKATFTPTVSMTGSNLYYAASGDFGAYSSWAWLTYTLKEVPHGYDFVGWYSMARSLSSREPNLISDYTQFLGNEKTLILEYPVTEHKLYAYNLTSWQYDYPLLVKFEPISHTATFDYDFDGISVDVTETFDAKYNLPATPTRTGYTFVGWFRGKSSNEQISADDVVKSVSDETFYAHWLPIEVTFALDPGSGSLGAYSSKITLTYDQSYDLPTPVWEGHTFNGWFTAASGGTKIAASGTCKFTADQMLYAQYTINRHEITYSKIGSGSGSISPGGTYSYDYGTKVKLTASPNRGNEFIGWNDGVTDAEREITVTTNKTYSAEFRLKTFTVTFDPGTGTVSPTSKTATFSKKFGELPTPRCEGYNFDGWQTSGGTRITADTTVDLDGDIVLTAKYTIIRCAVQVIKAACEGSGTVSGGGTYDYGYDLTIQAYPSEGSHFVKWNDGDTNASRVVKVTSNVTYSANFALNEYTVKFIYYNASGQQVIDSQQVKYGKAATPPSATVVDNYPKHTFIGWGNNGYGTVKGNMEISAVYDVYSYKVHFNPNCASYSGSAMLTQTFKVDEQKSLSLNTYERAGYDFIGWSRNPSDTTAMYINGQTVECLTDVKDFTIELYALWKAREYEVSFSENGGDAPSKSSIKVTYDSTYGTLPTCSRTGYMFAGWYTSSTGGNEVKEDTEVKTAKDHTLYAHWTANKYTVNFVSNGGDDPSQLTMEVSFDSNYGTMPTCNRTGYTLEGWYTDGGSKIDYWTKVTITEAQTLYAHWTANKYIVNFETDEGDSCSPIVVIFDGRYDNLPLAHWTDHDFLGWIDAEGNSITKETKVTRAEDHTLTAQWKVQAYTVKFDANGGDGVMESQIINRGESTTLHTNEFTKIGWVFEKWEGPSKRYSDGAVMYNIANANETVTLKAMWRPCQYKIAFDANWSGGADVLQTEPPEVIDCSYADEEFRLTDWTPLTGGFAKFIGWSIDPMASMAQFANAAWVSEHLTEVDGATVTLYAVWQDLRNDLTKAIGCDNLMLSSEKKRASSSWGIDLAWIGAWRTNDYGIESGGFQNAMSAQSSDLTANISTNGTLVFEWQRMTQDDTIEATFQIDFKDIRTASVEKTKEYVEINLNGKDKYPVSWCATKGGAEFGSSEGGSLQVYSIRWYPGMTEAEVKAMEGGPEPSEADAPTISGDFSFATDARFDYIIWKKQALTDDEWLKHSTVTGDGKAVKLPMFEAGETQGFFKVEVIQRK